MTDQQQDNQPTNFAAYLIAQILSDPRTSALIGTGIRWLLTMAGTALAAHPAGRMLAGAASDADWITMAAGAVLGVLTLVWGIWQKFRAAKALKVAIASPAVPAPLPAVGESKP